MPSDPDTVFKNSAQVSHQYPSFSLAYRLSGRHASMSDRPFFLVVLATLNDLSHHKKGNASQVSLPSYRIPWISTDPFRPLDNNVVTTFVFRHLVTKYVLASELVKDATLLSQHLV